MFQLQNRWKIVNKQLKYYGIRKKPYLLINSIKLTTKQLNILNNLPKQLNNTDQKVLKDLINQQIVVPIHQLRSTPNCLEDAQFCISCCANDFMIPGIEFNEFGVCPICDSSLETKDLKSVVPLQNTIPINPKGRFDVALFYTGGKDSTFLLYYLSKVLKLRVLALTWELPFLSDSAKASINNAKKCLPNVEFITRSMANSDLRKIYQKIYSLNENTCCCPSLAYVLFYPELVSNRIPYFVVGNEPAQMKNLYYNNMAPKISYRFSENRWLNILVNMARIMTLHPPYKKGQFHTLMTMKQLANKNILKKVIRYENELLDNVCIALKEVKYLTKPLKRAISSSSWRGNIPAFVHIDFNDISGGIYDWHEVKKLISDETGWVEPSSKNKGLHTSCSIEKCKEYSQFNRFYHMRSQMIPFSAIELAIASRDHNISREDAILEINESLGFALTEIRECQIMHNYLRSYK